MSQNPPQSQNPQPQQPKRDSGFVKSFKQSNWITDGWNWFMVFAGKGAEPVLILSVLYSSAKLLPALQPYLNAQMDAGVFIAQFVALDVGGLSLNKMAKLVQATNPAGAKNALRLSIALVVIMILGVILASLSPLMAKVPQVSSVIDTILLIARAILAVLYSRVIHSLKGHDDPGSQGHGGSGGNGGPGSQPPTPFDPDAILHEVHNIVNQAVNQASRELAESLQGSQQQLMSQASRELAESVQGTVKLLEQRVSAALAALPAGYNSLEGNNQAGSIRLLSSGARPTRSTSRQFVEALPARTQAGVEAQGRAMLNSQAGHAQPTYVQGATALNIAEVPETDTDKVHAVNQSRQTVNLEEVHATTPGQFMNPAQVQNNGTRVSRELVTSFVVNYWTEHQARPKLQIVQDATGCSKGQASQCINLVAPQFGATVVTEE